MSTLSKILGINIDLSKSVQKAEIWITKQELGSSVTNAVATGLIEVIKANPTATLAEVQSQAVTLADASVQSFLEKLPIPLSTLSLVVFDTEEPTLNTILEQGIAAGYIKAFEDAVGASEAATILAAQGISAPK